MENKGLNVFNDKLVLASPETATDSDYGSIEAVIAHEYFHNWTGNRITCRDWFQLCLKEGLTVFRDQEFTADLRSRAVERIARRARPARPSIRRGCRTAGASGAARALPRDQQLLHRDRLSRRAREVIRMLKIAARRRRLPRVAWTSISSVMTAAPRRWRNSSPASPRRTPSTSRSSCCWYSQAGTPELAATGNWDQASRTYRLDMVQTVPPTPGQPVKQPMMMPFVVGLVGPDGRDFDLVLDDGRKVEARRAHRRRRLRNFRVQGRRRTACRIAQSRLLGSRQSRCRPVRQGPAFPGGP